jgi:AraC-like DNA-binding protein
MSEKNNEIEITKSVLVRRKVLVNLGDYNNEEAEFFLMLSPTIQDMDIGNAALCDLVDNFVFNSHVRHQTRIQLINDAQMEAERLRIIEGQKKLRKIINAVFEFVKNNPNQPIGDIAAELELTDAETRRILQKLQEEGRIDAVECKERYTPHPRYHEVDHGLTEDEDNILEDYGRSDFE